MSDRKPRRQSSDTPLRRNTDAALTDLIHHDRALARPVAGTIRIGAPDADSDEHGGLDREVQQGASVLCKNGEKIGEVVDVEKDYLVVEQGFFIPRDIYIPASIIARHDGNNLYLTMTMEEFDKVDWSQEPEADNGGDAPAT